jgi:hypothetical protein
MPRHRGLTLKKLLIAINPELMERYFTEKLPSDTKLPQRFVMSPEAVEVFIEDNRNTEAKALVLEDFQKINDICEKAKSYIVRAFQQFNIPWEDGETPENLAMRLFLDHKEAFDFAYTWYCYYHTSSALSSHRIPGEFKLTQKTLNAFLKEIKEWFKQLAKGNKCIITRYEEEDTTVILIKHGSYVRTIAYWNEDKIDITSFRPANEDILLYNSTNGILQIKASLQKDREQYIESFSRCIMGDESLANSDDRDETYTLKPLQDGSFDWNGNEHISEILLTEIKLRLSGSTEPVVNISSGDVRKSLRESLRSIDLSDGELTYARFRFVLNVDGKKQKVSVSVTPPAKTDLSQKRHTDIISAYLKEQGVQLV